MQRPCGGRVKEEQPGSQLVESGRGAGVTLSPVDPVGPQERE